MKKETKRAATPNTVNAGSIAYMGLTYVLYGLKTIFDVYIHAGMPGAYNCITQFGERVAVSVCDGQWVDAFTGQQTSASRAIGVAIENKKQVERYILATK
jgi:hypothetical protein